MKKILVMVLLVFSLTSNAFWNNNNWNNGWNNGWGNGWSDNGFFSYNPYDYWDPRWYAQEMENMIDEFDDNGWGNNNYNNYAPYGYGYNPANNRNSAWGNNPWQYQTPFAPNMPTKTKP